jgi:hypothetical protein
MEVMVDLEDDMAERAASEERRVAMADTEEDSAEIREERRMAIVDSERDMVERRVAMDTLRMVLPWPLHRY